MPTEFGRFLDALKVLERLASLDDNAHHADWLWIVVTSLPRLAVALLSRLHSKPNDWYAVQSWDLFYFVFEKYMKVHLSSSRSPLFRVLKMLRGPCRVNADPCKSSHIGGTQSIA